MARRSRKKINRTVDNTNAVVQTGIYIRRSARSDEKNSLKNQCDLVLKYLDRCPDIRIWDIYSDDGYSGMNFNRPGYRRMYNDIENGRLGCVAVKDLSRLGRGFIETGRLVSIDFPARGVRLISVNDKLDTAKKNESELLTLPLTNLVNECYARDIALKTASALEMKKAKGEYVYAQAPYGYQKSPKNKRRLIIDPVTAPVVQRIFTQAARGMPLSTITKNLEEEQVLSPGQYRKSRNKEMLKENRWHVNTIKKILANPLYMGYIPTGKPEGDCSRILRHMPLVSQELFLVVNRQRGTCEGEKNEK